MWHGNFSKLKAVTKRNVVIVNNTLLPLQQSNWCIRSKWTFQVFGFFKSTVKILCMICICQDSIYRILLELIFVSFFFFLIHSRDGSCELFPREMVESWEEQINNHQAVGQLQAELFPQHGLACLNCRQFNAKVSKAFCLFLTKIWHESICWMDLIIVKLLNW